MMSKSLLLLLVIFAITENYCVDGWLKRVKRWFSKNDRNCFCKAVDADTNVVIHDFGSIQKCSGWPTCACRRHEMITCGDKCDQRVEGWVKDNKAKCEGRYVKKHYKASTCSQAYGHERREC